MARLALSIAGGILGAVFLPGIGASLGWSIGAAAGGIIGALAFPGKGQHVYGARLNDLSVSSSAPGTVIPILYGSMRLGGQIIWSSGIQEVTTTKKQSAKGGPSVTQTEYTYFVSFAAAFCQGEAKITRVWGDAKLIYDTTGTGQLVKNLSVFPTIYPGSETQTADPTIVSHEGATVTPAYRGVCYAVWEKFPLANFGNRLPNIRAEVTSQGTASHPLTTMPWQGSGTTISVGNIAIDYNANVAYIMRKYAPSGIHNTEIQRVDLSTNTIVARGLLDLSPVGIDASAIGHGGIDVDLQSGYLLIDAGRCIVKVDPWSFKAIKAASYRSAVGANDGQMPILEGSDGYIAVFGRYAPKYGGTISNRGMCMIRCSDMTVVGTYQEFPASASYYQGHAIQDAEGCLYWIYCDGGVNYVCKIRPASGVFKSAVPPAYADVTTWSFPYIATQGNWLVGLYHSGDNSLIVMTDAGAYVKVDCATGTILDQVGDSSNKQFFCASGRIGKPSLWLSYQYDFASGTNGPMQHATLNRTYGGTFWAPALDGTSLLSVSATDFSVVATYDLHNWAAKLFTNLNWSPNIYCRDTVSNAILSMSSFVGGDPDNGTVIYRAYFDRISTNGLSAANIVSDICQKAGIDPSNIDTSLITALTVRGYPIAQLQTGKDIINTLGQALFFEGRETDFKLQFVPRGGASVMTIPETDLGMAQDKAKLTEVMGQEQDVPKEVEIVYNDPNIDYQQNKQHRVRHSRTKRTTNKTSISMPLVMDAQSAAQLADRLLWVSDIERRTYKTNLWKAKYILLDPCDVVSFAYDGVQLTARVQGNTIGQNYAAALDLVNEDTASYLTSQSGNSATGFVPQVLLNLAQTTLYLLDIPYLQDQDADASGNTGFYFAMTPSSNGTWGAGVLYQSSDDQSFGQIDASTTKVAYGVAQNVLGTPRSPWTWDTVNTLTIRLVQGDAPTSDTQLNVLNGKNAVLMYPSLEVIQYTTVVDNGDGTYTLSGLLRGRRGTEWASYASAHAVGEICLLPLQGGFVHEQISLSSVGQERYYKAVTVGADLNSVPNSTVFSVIGRDLMPYAPVQITGNKSGNDWTLGWLRRTRLGGGWVDLYGDVPLSEDGQGYTLEITDSGGTVKRTVTVTTNRFTYTSAMQVADFGSNQSTIYVNIYQLSGQVGRGFKATATITKSQTLPPVDTAPALTNTGAGSGGWLVNGT